MRQLSLLGLARVSHSTWSTPASPVESLVERFALATVLASQVLGCAGSAPASVERHVEAPPSDPGPPPYVSPARWDFHPSLPTVARSFARLDAGCVFTAEGGQRWITASSREEAGRTTCTGKATASPFVAPEDLTSIIRLPTGKWLFVGETGTLYESQGPLTAFSRTIAAPEPFFKVVGEGTLVLATTLEGKVLRWEEARGWHRIEAGLGAAHVFDLAIGSGGQVIGLGFPEAIFTSDDGATTFVRATVPTLGAHGVGRAANGELVVQGLYEALRYRPKQDPLFVRSAEGLRPSSVSLDLEASAVPSVPALQSGRAAVDVDRYYELVRANNEGDSWVLARGRIDGGLTTTPLPFSCTNMKIGLRGKFVFTVCANVGDSDAVIDVRRSSDGGTSWSEPLRLTTPDADQTGIAVSPDGVALVSGVCKVADPPSQCRPGPPLLIRVGGGAAEVPAGSTAPQKTKEAGESLDLSSRADAGEAPSEVLRVAPSSASQLNGLAAFVAFSYDGASAYFLGRRGKDDRLSLFVSHDAGASFSPRALEAPTQLSHGSRRTRGRDEDEPAETSETFDTDDQSALRPADDGTLGILVTRPGRGFAYITADDDGRVMQVGTAPPEEDSTLLLGGYGRRVLALASNHGEGGRPAVWESLDGGLTWELDATPEVIVREFQRATLGVACSYSGCLVGDALTRLGWGRQGEATPFEPPPEPPPPPSSVQTPIVCDLLPNTKWSRIDNLYPTGMAGFPDGMDAMRGRSVWSVLSLDPRTGLLETRSATLPESGTGEARIVVHTLFPSHPPSARMAYAISSTQYEGYAAVRVQVPVDAQGAVRLGEPMRNVEVAWENFLEGTFAKGRIADAGPFVAKDVKLGSFDLIDAELVSIAPGGLFVRPHHRGSPFAYFVDASGKVEHYVPANFPSPMGIELEHRVDATVVGGQLIDVGYYTARAGNLRQLTHFVFARRDPKNPTGPFTFTPITVASPVAHDQGAVTYSPLASIGKYATALATLVADNRHRAYAELVAMRSDGTFGPATPLPTLYDLGDRPKPCTPTDRASTPRFMVPYALYQNRSQQVLFPGARHPVLINDVPSKHAVGVVEPMSLVTGSAVVHGTPNSPCIAAWHATEALNGSLSAILPGDLSRAWVFRPAAPSTPPRPSEPPALEYRPMSCHFDAQAHIPEALYRELTGVRP